MRLIPALRAFLPHHALGTDRFPLVLLVARPLDPVPLPQHLPRPLLKRLDHHPGDLGRGGLAQRAVHGARELGLDDEGDLGAGVRGVGLGGAFLRRGAVRGQGLEGELAEGPAREEGGEELLPLLLLVGLFWFFFRGGVGWVVRELGGGDRGSSGPGAGFQGVVREAVDAGAEGFVVAAPADAEVGGAGPAFLVGRVGG